MMLKSKKAFTLLALAGLAFASTAAHAATTAYTNGDIFLGFRQAGNNNSLVVNIGQAGQYRDGTTTGALSLGNLGADLDAWYGSNGWTTDSNVFWGVVGTTQTSINGDGASTLYASKPESILGVAGTAYDRAAVATQNQARSNIVTMTTAYAGKTSTTNSSVVLNQLNSVAGAWGATTGASASNGFSYFAGMEGNFGAGTSGSALDLFRMATGSGPGSYEGTFSINNSGVVSFSTTATVAPEPGRVAFLGLGLGAFFMRRRRTNR